MGKSSRALQRKPKPHEAALTQLKAHYLLGPVARVVGAASRSRDFRTIASGARAGEPVAVEVDSHVTGVLVHESGVLSTVVMSFDAVGTRSSSIEVHGTEASLAVPDPNRFDGEVAIHPLGSEWQKLPPSAGLIGAGRGVGLADLATTPDGDEPRAGARLGYHVLDVMLSLLEAAEHSAVVEVASTCERPEPLDAETVRKAFASVSSPGRLEVVRRSPTVVLDAAHNPAGALATAEAVGEAFDFSRLIGVVVALPGIWLVAREPVAEDVTGAPPSSSGALDGVPWGYLGYEEHEAGSKGLHMNFVFVADVSEEVEVVPCDEMTDHRWVDRAGLDELDSPLNVRQFGHLALDAVIVPT